MIVNRCIVIAFVFIIYGCNAVRKNQVKREWSKFEITKQPDYEILDVFILDKNKNRTLFKLYYKRADIDSGYYHGYLKENKIVLDGTAYYYVGQTGFSYHETYSQFKNGKKTGVSYTLNGGKILTLDEYKNGKVNGNSLWFNPSKKVLSSCSRYKDDVINGKSIRYYSNGYIKSIFNMENGKKKGEYMLYHSNGFVKENGKYSGKFMSYNEDSSNVYKLPFFNEKNEYVDVKKEYSKEFLDIFFKEFNKRQSDTAFFLFKKGEVIFYDTQGRIIKKYLYDEKGDLVEVITNSGNAPHIPQ